MKFCLFLLLIFFSAQLYAQPRELNLQMQWQVYQNGSYVPFANQTTQSVHLELSSKTHTGTLYITDRHEFSVLVNGQLGWRSADTLKINCDSLLRVAGGAARLSIYQQPRVYSLKTWLVIPNQQHVDSNALRPSVHFNNFIIIATFLLLFFMVGLFRANPQLTFDYLNVIKLFSIQERDEATVTGRIGASLNILYFAFVSFLFALLILILFRFSNDRFSLSTYFITESTVATFGIWLGLSVTVFVVLIVKLFLIFIFSQLFGLRDTVRFQFFHFVRLLFISGIGVCIVLIGFFIAGTSSAGAFAGLLFIAATLILISVAFLFLKLLGRTGLPVFHLFSYLCASEIIPLIIIGKVLLF
ncbi:MAG: DUF4271 domain-containing protein [Cytophagales bacterium]|nr:DUF4271 domain-containing protein [Cytophagales bacterium]